MAGKVKFRVFVWLQASLVILYLLGSIFLVALTHASLRQQALSEAESVAGVILERNLAIHAYLNQRLKPSVFPLAEGEDASYFDPTWMSSTYALRQIEQSIAQQVAHSYFYKECAIDARSPENEADDFERAFIEELNRSPELRTRSAIRTLDGERFLAVLHRGETMAKGCLRCHSTPQRAPAAMVGIYGPQRSFHRQAGEVVSAVSIRIPLDETFRRADLIAIRLSTVLFVTLIVILALHSLFTHRLIVLPLKRLRQQAMLISYDPEHLGETIPMPRGKELGEVTRGFNIMSESLRRQHDHLQELVDARTRELGEVNRHQHEDIRRREKAEKTLAGLLQQNEKILATARDGIFGLASDGRVTFTNPAAEAMTGWSRAELLGRNHHQLIHHSDASGAPYPISACPVHACLREGAVFHLVEETFWHRDGTPFPVEISCAPISDGETIQGAVITFRDITERKRHEDRVRQMAFYDHLTGLPNRTLLYERLAQATSMTRRDGSCLALLYLDLDNFKAINDRLGHAAGDQLLRVLSTRLRDTLRQADTVARVGGDEFVCFGFVPGKEEAECLARKILQQLQLPVDLDGTLVQTTASIGIAVFPDDGESLEELLKKADEAMYAAKERGRNTSVFHQG
ncbi:MAG: diguanylate cyclase [Desulfuromonadales bacterium]|nr:diguanylate cyclase [Desulfuromonadales bacterium]